jgi:hypothetical protein
MPRSERHGTRTLEGVSLAAIQNGNLAQSREGFFPSRSEFAIHRRA